MPEVEYTMVIRAPLEVVWDFSKDPAKWAHLLKGYQGHRVVNERETVWTLKADVDILARTADVHVTITEWLEKEKVAFALKGITEPIEGHGTIIVQPYSNYSSLNASKGRGPIKVLTRWFRCLFSAERGRPASTNSPLASKTATMVSVRMALYAGGMMGPLINAAISPLLHSVAEELAQKLTTTIEELYSEQAGKAGV